GMPGLAVSTDGGVTWTSPAVDPFAGGFAFTVTTDGTTILAGGQGATHSLAVSTDFGVTWTSPAVDPFPPASGGSTQAVLLDGATWYAAGNDATIAAHTVAFSTDAGVTWTHATTDPFPGSGGVANSI